MDMLVLELQFSLSGCMLVCISFHFKLVPMIEDMTK